MKGNVPATCIAAGVAKVKSASEVTYTAAGSTVSFLLKVYGTLEEVQRNHAVESLELNTTALELTAAGQTLEAKDIETAPISGVIERLSGDTCKHDVLL